MEKIKKWYIPAAKQGWELWMQEGDEMSLSGTYTKTLPKLDHSSSLMLSVEQTTCYLEKVFSGDLETEALAVETAIEVNSSDDVSSNQIGVYKIRELGEYSLYMGLSISSNIDSSKTWRDANFDYAPRARSINGDLAFWQEHGRWVYACYINDTCVYANVLSKSTTDIETQIKGLLPSIKLQLSLLGIEYEVKRAVVESSSDRIDLVKCEEILGCEMVCVERELLIQTQQVGLNYSPIRVELDRKKKRKKIKVMIAASVAVMGLAVIAYSMFNKLRELEQGIEANQIRILNNTPVYDDNIQYLARIDELELLVSEQWPLNNYSEIVKCIPPGERLIRIEMLEFRPGYVSIKGRSSNFASANKFGDALRKSDYFNELSWSKSTPVQALDKSHWKFDYRGEIKNEDYE